jgi:hypothetical protein
MPDFWFGSWGVGVILIAGRLLAASVEAWVLFEHLQAILKEDIKARRAG